MRERGAGAARENAEREQKPRKCDRMREQRCVKTLRERKLPKCDRTSVRSLGGVAQVARLAAQVAGLAAQVVGLAAQVAGKVAQVAGLAAQVAGLAA